MSQEERFFPEYLNRGCEGPAVAVLQLMLQAIGVGRSDEIEIDGQYGEVTAAAVQALQSELGVEPDGNFGPETREALKRELHIDVNALPAHIFQGETKGFSLDLGVQQVNP